MKSTWKPYKSNNSTKTLQFHGVQWEGYVSGFHEIRRISKDQLPGMVRPMFSDSDIVTLCKKIRWEFLVTFVALIFLKGLSSLSATKSKLNIFCADELKSEMGDRLYQKETAHGSCMDEWEGCCDPVWSSPSQVPTAHGNLEILEKSMDFAVMAFLQFWKI